VQLAYILSPHSTALCLPRVRLAHTVGGLELIFASTETNGSRQMHVAMVAALCSVNYHRVGLSLCMSEFFLARKLRNVNSDITVIEQEGEL